MRYLPILAVVAAFSWTGGAAAEIQIEGRVVDNQSLQPISGAEIRIENVRRPGRRLDVTYSDAQGRFSFLVERDGGYIFRAQRIGYESTDTPTLRTDGYRLYEVEIRLDPDAMLLAPIEVLVRSRGEDSPVLANFQHRARLGLGHYFTRRDIERLRPTHVTDLVARVPGVRLESSGAGLQRLVYMNRGPGGCRAEIFVDGMRWTQPITLGGAPESAFTLDDAVSPASVLGIEVYRGMSTVPAEFRTLDTRCGVVAVWTRR